MALLEEEKKQLLEANSEMESVKTCLSQQYEIEKTKVTSLSRDLGIAQESMCISAYITI